MKQIDDFKIWSFLNSKGYYECPENIEKFVISDLFIRFSHQAYEFHVNRKNLLRPLPNVKPFIKFFEYSGVNAVASVYEGVPVTLVSEGSFFILRDVFHRLLSHRNLFIGIGDPLEEALDSPAVLNYQNCMEDLLFNNPEKEGYKFYTPKNSDRKSLADFLTFLAMMFVFEHELSHLLNGHLNYLDKSLGMEVFDENIKIPQSLISQTLEFDADCTAINRCVNTLISWHETKHLDSKWQRFVECKYSMLYYLSFAVRTLYLIWIIRPGKFSLNSSSHPTPKMRAIWCRGAICEFIKKKHKGFDHQKVYEHVEKGALYAYSCYINTVQNPINPYVDKDGCVSVSSDDETKQFFKIKGCWSDIRNDLEEYAYQTIAP